jgi:hypothetical protein
LGCVYQPNCLHEAGAWGEVVIWIWDAAGEEIRHGSREILTDELMIQNVGPFNWVEVSLAGYLFYTNHSWCGGH